MKMKIFNFHNKWYWLTGQVIYRWRLNFDIWFFSRSHLVINLTLLMFTIHLTIFLSNKNNEEN